MVEVIFDNAPRVLQLGENTDLALRAAAQVSGTLDALLDLLAQTDAAATPPDYPPPLISPVIARVAAFMATRAIDYRGDSLPNAYRRVIEYRRPIGGGDVFDVVAEKSMNTTSVGYCLRFLAGAVEQYPSLSQSFGPLIVELAEVLLAAQHVDSRKARFGGFALAPKEGAASCYNAAMCGLGLLAAYRVTLNPLYLAACKRAATFLGVLNNPNPTYQALYGVTPIPAVSQNAGWNGFCDQISNNDTILITHTTWNLLACKFLKQLYDLTGTASYNTLMQATRDWAATGVTGFWDFYAIYNTSLPSQTTANWQATGLTVSDGAWHRRGESVIAGGTITRTSTIQAATSTTVTLDAGASATTGAYNGMAIRMTTGAATNKGSVITAYNGSTKVATLQYPFPATPSAGDTYQVGVSANTIGSDQMEYGIEALYDAGYNLTALKSAYETIASWPNADSGAFGTAYDSRICWTEFFRPFAQVYGGASRAFGTRYDVQGIGPLLKFKRDQYPTHYVLSFEKALAIPEVATVVDKDWNTVWGTDASGQFETSTVGVGTVKGAVALGIVEAYSA